MYWVICVPKLCTYSRKTSECSPLTNLEALHEQKIEAGVWLQMAWLAVESMLKNAHRVP